MGGTIMAENENTQTAPPKPNLDLKSLEKLVGTWKVSGGIKGTNTYEWMEGGFFLVQRFDFDHDGREIKGVEIIGHKQKFGESRARKSRRASIAFSTA
jgi:hypothetical protein